MYRPGLRYLGNFLQYVWQKMNRSRKHQTTELSTTHLDVNQRQESTIPISIRGVEVRRRIWPPEAVCHVRIETPRTILFHSGNIGPLRQNLEIYKSKSLHNLKVRLAWTSFTSYENSIPSADGHAVQIHSRQVPLEQLRFQGIPHKQNP